MKSSLQSKIASAMWVMTAVSTLASAALAGALLISSHRESVRQQLQATATTLVSLGITHFSELKDFADLNRFVEDALQMDRIDKIIRVYESDRDLIFTTAGADYDRLPERLNANVTRPIFLTVAGTQRRYESLVMPYEGEGSRKKYYLQVAIPLPRYAEVLDYLWWQSLLLLSLLIGISVLLSHWLSKRLLAPVGEIARHLERMDPARIDAWEPLTLDRRSRYLAAIADGINALAGRTKQAMAQLSKMGRYVAHEMRTPLTILQGEAETVLARPDATARDYESVLRSSLEEIQRMGEIVSTVLEVGESAGSSAPERALFDLADWLEEHRGEWERALGRPIGLSLPSDLPVRAAADARLLHRLIDNLIRNVKEHTPPGTRCAIVLGKGAAGPELSIEDGGPGMAEAALRSLDEQGGLADVAGVGLNLCYRIAELGGLKLVFAARPGGGLIARIGFPQ